MRSGWMGIAGIALAGSLSLTAYAQSSVTIFDEYEKLIQSKGAVGTLGNDLFGEQISLYGGGLEFIQTDVSLPGNNALPVAIGRRFTPNQDKDPGGHFGDWQLEIPRLHGVFDANRAWTVPVDAGHPASDAYLRCSNFGAPPASTGQSGGGTFAPQEFWQGNFLYLPGSGDQEILRKGHNNLPTDGKEYNLVTKSGAAISCLPALASTSTGSGEGFEVLTPDGTRYRFDHLVSRYNPALTKPGAGPLSRAPSGFLLRRQEVWILPTIVTDRFGNMVTYQWSSTDPWQLLSITGETGRQLSLTYLPGTHQIVTVSDGTRTWSYAYEEFNGTSTLASVTQPDQSRWTFALDPLRMMAPFLEGGGCGSTGWPNVGERVGTMTHPSGAVGAFTVEPVTFGRSWIPLDCLDMAEGGGGFDRVPAASVSPAIKYKKLSGPGLPAAGETWTYAYGPANACYQAGGPWNNPSPCNASSPVTRTVTVTDPEGVATRYIFGNRYEVSEGQLQRTEVDWNGSSALSTTDYTYANPAAGPYPDPVGYSAQMRGDAYLSTRHTPQKSKVITQQATTFSQVTDTFDVWARPLQVRRFSSLGASRTDVTAYYDHSAKWILGQIASVTKTAPAPVQIVSAASYDATTAQPTQISSFGQVVQTLTYHADGNVATAADGTSHATTLSAWYRGIPRSIEYADGQTQSATVNGLGWVTSVTDETNATTGYGYDAMGRLASITYPAGDTVNWANTTQVFEQIAAAEYGIPAGHWRQTISTGNARKVSYFDALWRPLVVREYDAANIPGTQRFSRFAYDANGRTTFSSYPGTTDALNAGTWTEYDALGRATSVSQDSELALLTTTTRYLPAFLTEVRNPRNQVTLTGYLAYEAPSMDWPVSISHPEGAYTDITRDPYGKPTTLTRRNANGSMVVTRSYAYDARQRLCRSEEPETGVTLMGYDNAGNLVWSAGGLEAALTCTDSNAPAVAQRKVTRNYDERNRVTELVFPLDKGINTTSTYEPDGLLKTITADNGNGEIVTTTYTYNKRRLPTSERLQFGSVDWSLGYGYDIYGHLASQVSPGGLTVTYAPNALGQATQAGSYATGVQYYPNGAVKQFTYGNGIVHTMTQNARQLPARSTDAGGGNPLDLAYGYDGNANVTSITDYTDGRQTRTMTYDGLDRLLTAQSVMFGGSDNIARYTYDVLDNLNSLSVNGRNYGYVYEPATQRLGSITNGVGGVSIIGLGYDEQGNLKNRNGRLYTFDYGNRLRQVAASGTAPASGYAYDGHGRRVRDTTTASKYSLYSQAGQLVYEDDLRQAKRTQYVSLAGSLVARVVNSTAPATPALTVPAFSGNGSYAVSWTSEATATGYELQERPDAGTWQSAYAGASLSLAVAGKAPGNYGYRVRACLNAGCSQWSAESLISVQSAPDGVPTLSAPALAPNGNYTVGWTAVSGATSYTLEESPNGGAWSSVYSGANLSHVYAGKAAGSYSYRVEACNAAGCGAASATKTVQAFNAPSAAPTVTAPATNATGAYTVSWTAVSGATTYQVEESVNGGTWSQIHNAAGLSKAISGKGTGSYAYRAKACNEAGCGSLSATKTTQVTLPPATAPAVTAPATSSTGNYTVSWTTVSGATSYTLEESANGGSWTSAYTGSATSLAISGKATGSYAYRALACNAGGCSSVSASKTTQVTLPPASAPTVTAPATSTNGSYTVSWTAVSGATSYTLEESFNGGAWSGIYSGAATSQALSGRSTGSYSYRAKACNAGGCGATSAAKTTQVTLPPATAPTISAPATNATGSYTVSWTSVSGATTYQLEESANGGTWTQIHNAAGSSKAISGKGTGSFAYRARACNGSGCGPNSATVTVAVTLPPPPVPTGLFVTYNSGTSPSQMNFTWNAATGATSYQLTGGGVTYSGSATSYQTSLSNPTQYQYAVRSCNANGCSAWSVSVKALPELRRP